MLKRVQHDGGSTARTHFQGFRVQSPTLPTSAAFPRDRFGSGATLASMTSPTSPLLCRSLFVFSLLYGGMVVIAGVLGVKQVALGPLAVEAGIFAFLLLVAMGSAVAELHGRKTADAIVRWGFLPLIVSAILIQVVLALPHDAGMYPPASPPQAFRPRPVRPAFPRPFRSGAVARGRGVAMCA